MGEGSDQQGSLMKGHAFQRYLRPSEFRWHTALQVEASTPGKARPVALGPGAEGGNGLRSWSWSVAGAAGPSCGPGEEIGFYYKVSALETGSRQVRSLAWWEEVGRVGREVGRKGGCGLVGAEVVRTAPKKVRERG